MRFVREIIRVRVTRKLILGDLELELERVLLEKSDVQDMLMKMEAICSNHEQDKQRLQEELKKVKSTLTRK